MNADLPTMIARLQRSTQNVNNATNPAQLEAAQTFLVERGREVNAECKKLADWLEEADAWMNQKHPELAADARHEFNAEWLARLAEYKTAQQALDDAWAAYMQRLERAA
jgi:hypothetical protein